MFRGILIRATVFVCFFLPPPKTRLPRRDGRRNYCCISWRTLSNATSPSPTSTSQNKAKSGSCYGTFCGVRRATIIAISRAAEVSNSDPVSRRGGGHPHNSTGSSTAAAHAERTLCRGYGRCWGPCWVACSHSRSRQQRLPIRTLQRLLSRSSIAEAAVPQGACCIQRVLRHALFISFSQLLHRADHTR